MLVLRPIAALLALGLVVGCGGGNEGPDGPTATDAANELAAALSTGSLEDIETRSGDPEADLPELLKGMHGLLPSVKVNHVSPTAQAATIKLGYSWPLSSPWTYETDAVMVREGRDWKLIWTPEVLHPKLTEGTRLERQRGEASERGNIIGRSNAVLVQSTPIQMLGLDKTGLDGPTVEESAREVATAAKVDVEAYVEKARSAGATAFIDAVPVRSEDIPANFLATEGAATRTITMPAPKSSGYAQALLGTIGYATEEQATEAGIGVAPGDLVGVSGLQRTFDERLRGSTGNRVFLAEREAPVGSGSPTNDTLIADFPDAPGNSLETTIDDDIQTAAEQSLSAQKVRGSIVVLDTETGAILAAADSPEARRQDDSMNGRFAPGLAAAPVGALALMRSGVDLSDRVQCEREVETGGRTFENADGYRRGYGQMTLSNAMAYECLTAVAAASSLLDPAMLPEAAKSLGLTQAYDLGTASNFGEFPPPADPLAKAEALIGQGAQGAVQSSALGLATMAASVQAEETIVPVLTPERQPEAQPAAPLTEDEIDMLQTLMKASSGSYRPLTGASAGEADARDWAVGYGSTYAIAVVLDEKATASATQIVRTIGNTATRALR